MFPLGTQSQESQSSKSLVNLPNGVLSLQTEEKSLREVLHIVHTDHVLWTWFRLQIS